MTLTDIKIGRKRMLALLLSFALMLPIIFSVAITAYADVSISKDTNMALAQTAASVYEKALKKGVEDEINVAEQDYKSKLSKLNPGDLDEFLKMLKSVQIGESTQAYQMAKEVLSGETTWPKEGTINATHGADLYLDHVADADKSLGTYPKGTRVIATGYRLDGAVHWYSVTIPNVDRPNDEVSGYMLAKAIEIPGFKPTYGASTQPVQGSEKEKDDVTTEFIGQAGTQSPSASGSSTGQTGYTEEQIKQSVLGEEKHLETPAEYNSYVNSIFSVIMTLGTAGGAVGIAWCGIEYAYGSEEVANKAKSKAIVIAASVAALCLLILFIKLGANLGKQYAWDPANLK